MVEIHLDNEIKQSRPIESDGYCRHAHISERTRTEGTPYVKGWCEKCGAWVFTNKTFCICCRKRVQHKVHHRHTKQVLEHAVLLHERLWTSIESYHTGKQYGSKPNLRAGVIIYHSRI